MLQAFSIYCDSVVSGATEKNARLRTENASLEKMFVMTHTVQVCHRDNDPLDIRVEHFVEEKIELPSDDEEDEEGAKYMVYEMNDANDGALEFPWEQVKCLSFKVSGVLMPSTLPFGPKPEFIVLQDEDAVQVTLYCAKGVAMQGTIRNIAGSMDDVYDMIDTNEIMVHYMLLGGRDRNGNRVPRTGHFGIPPILDDATFSVDKILIEKHILQPALECINAKLDYKSSLKLKDLINLAKSNPTHNSLGKVAVESQSLELRNAMLKASQDLVRWVDVSYPGAEHSLRVLLELGCRTSRVGEHTWSLRVEPCAESTIPLSSITKMQFHLATSVPWSRRAVSTMELEPFFTGDWFLIVKYSPAITGIFCFDESLNRSVLDSNPGGVVDYIQSVLYEYTGNGIMPTQAVEMTMRLVQIHLRLDSIQHILDALGVDTNCEEGTSFVGDDANRSS